MGRNSIVYVKNSIRWYLGKSVQIKDTWVCVAQNRVRIVRHGDSSKGNDDQLSKIEDDGEKEYRSEITSTKLWRQTRVNRNWSNGQESKGNHWCWRRKRFQANGKETSAVSSMRVTIVHKNRTWKPPRLLSHQCRKVVVCQGKEVSEAKGNRVWFFDNRAYTNWKVLVRNRFVSIGILPSVNSTKQKRVVKQEISVCSRITRLTNNQPKGRKRTTIPQKRKAKTRML